MKKKSQLPEYNVEKISGTEYHMCLNPVGKDCNIEKDKLEQLVINWMDKQLALKLLRILRPATV